MPATSAAWAWTQSGPSVAWIPPNEPIPPAAETAAASVPPLCIAIGAAMIGCSRPNSSVKRVRITLRCYEYARGGAAGSYVPSARGLQPVT